MNEQILSTEEIERELTKLNVAWSAIPAQGLVRVFETVSFSDGLALMLKIGEIAEKIEHYPTIKIGPEQVEVVTITDESGVTQRDFELAKEIDKFV